MLTFIYVFVLNVEHCWRVFGSGQ